MPKNVRLIVPYLPRAPQEYSASQFEKILNSLRLYFELVSAEFRSDLGDTEIDGDLTVSGTVTAPTFVGALTGNATTATLASTVTVTDSTANTDFPVAFHDESNALLDDTGVFEYNPSTGKLTVSQVDILKAGSNEAVLRVGRNTNENLKITVDDPNVTILADQDSDSSGTHNFILNRVFGGNGLSNFTVQHDGNDEFTISDNGGTVTATFNSSVVINDNLLEVISTDAGTTVNPILSLYRNSASPAASDDLGAIQFYGQDDAGNKTLYAQIHGFAQDETGGTEDGQIHFSCMAGALFEDPVMKLTKSSLELNSNNDLILGQNCEIRFETSGNDAHETILYGVQATQDNTVLLPNLSGTLPVLQASNVATYFEVANTDDGAKEKPVLSLFRDSASPATSDRLGSLRFFGENSSGEKVFYAGINGAIGSSKTDGSEVGAIHFSLADGSGSGSAVTDPSADITTDEDPVVSIYKYGLVMRAGNDIHLATQNDVLEWADTGSHDQLLQGRQTETSGGRSTVSMPDANQGVLEIGALGTGAVVTGTSITHANFTGYRGQKVVFTGSSNCTIGLPDAVAGDVGATWTICNAGSALVIFDLDASAAQTVKILTGAAVVTVGTDNPHIIAGGVASLVCTAADNYILFGSGVVDN